MASSERGAVNRHQLRQPPSTTSTSNWHGRRSGGCSFSPPSPTCSAFVLVPSVFSTPPSITFHWLTCHDSVQGAPNRSSGRYCSKGKVHMGSCGAVFVDRHQSWLIDLGVGQTNIITAPGVSWKQQINYVRENEGVEIRSSIQTRKGTLMTSSSKRRPQKKEMVH